MSRSLSMMSLSLLFFFAPIGKFEARASGPGCGCGGSGAACVSNQKLMLATATALVFSYQYAVLAPILEGKSPRMRAAIMAVGYAVPAGLAYGVYHWWGQKNH